MNVLAYFLPVILALGLITSYEDVKTGKIRNKWIIFALAYAFAVYSIIITHSFFTIGVYEDYFIALLTNMLFVIIVGFGAWYFGIWTAGDGKLFIAFSSLIPITTYQTGYQEWMPSITLLINIFIPSLFIMIFWMFFKIRVRNFQKIFKFFLKDFFQPRQLFISVIEIFAVYWIISLLISLVNLKGGYVLTIILTIVLLSSIQKTLSDKYVHVFIAISLIRLVMDESVYSSSFLADFLIIFFIWRLFKSLLAGSLSKISQEMFSKEVKVIDLKPGMVLSETIQKVTKPEWDKLKKLPDTELIKHKTFYYIKRAKSSTDTGGFIGEESEGLTNEQIRKIKGIGIKKILVSQTIPFAPFMFLGVILTVIVKGNILIVIKNLF